MINKIKTILLKIYFSYIYRKFCNYTMIPKKVFVNNLLLSFRYKHIEGEIVECGVWRGGMIAGLAEIYGSNREYHLFDSFEGLPKVKEIDGEDAKKWQQDTQSKGYYDNCKAEISFSVDAMRRAKVSNVFYHKGWFNETLKSYKSKNGIAILRMDADWYDSTYEILDNMFFQVVNGGIIIIDDYYAWEGCSKAVHDFLSKNNLPCRVREFNNSVFFIQKNI